MRLYRYEPPPTHDEDGEEIIWAPPVRVICEVPAHRAITLMREGWKLCDQE